MSDIRTNAGFVITNAIPVGNREIVLGVNMKNPQSFVTWECKEGTDYYWGHYTDNLIKATRDLCQRVIGKVDYLELAEQERREVESRYILTATVKHEGNSAIIQFPTKELGDILGSIGISLPPERVYLGGHTDIEVHLQLNGNPMIEAMVHLFSDKNSLRMVNEVTKAVFHSDWRVYERVEEKLKMDFYVDVENLLRDVVDYSKYLKDKQRDSREER